MFFTILLLGCGDNIKTNYYENGLIKTQWLENEKNKKHGFYRRYTRDGNVLIEGNFKNDREFGRWYVYYEDTKKIHREMNFISGYKHGKEIVYHENGTIESEFTYNHGEKEGIYKEFHSNGQLRSVIFYVNGVRDGNSKIYDEKGNMLENLNYENGSLMGEQKYYKNKKLIKKRILTDSKETIIIYKNNKIVKKTVKKRENFYEN